VNRLGHVQLNGNLEKKMALMKLKHIVQHEDAMAQECSEDLKKKLNTNGITKYCVEIAL
jgi:hypothetical protein